MAIGIKVKKAPEKYDLSSSKFFGTPTVPMDWEDDFYDDEIFFCQIRLEDIASLDRNGELPHTGYLYVFLHTEGGIYNLEADVRYFNGEIGLAIDDFNTAVEGYEHYNDAYLMEFYYVDDCEACTRLLGIPSDWNYEESPRKMLMQYDPLDSDMGFLDLIDGFFYLFFEKDGKNLENITLYCEYS